MFQAESLRGSLKTCTGSAQCFIST